jgi:hypothetical protein
MGDSQSRKWQITINNPSDANLNSEALREILMKFFPTYFCFAYEVSTTGTPHVHAFLYSDSPIRFSTLKKRLPVAHLEKAHGSVLQNREYIQKSGKWENDAKAETRVEGSFFEYGEIPSERAESCPKMSALIEDVREGKSNVEILTDTPSFAFKVRDIDVLRQTLQAERFTVENRNICVVYIFGATGTGKTKSVYDAHDPREIYRLTNYRTGRGVSFDGYFGQDVLVFEEFRGQIPIADMLNFLDPYPIFLPARYNDRIACYTKVYITSNIPLNEQYGELQRKQRETWRAFLRRIHEIKEYKSDGRVSAKILNGGGRP